MTTVAQLIKKANLSWQPQHFCLPELLSDGRLMLRRTEPPAIPCSFDNPENGCLTCDVKNPIVCGSCAVPGYEVDPFSGQVSGQAGQEMVGYAG